MTTVETHVAKHSQAQALDVTSTWNVTRATLADGHKLIHAQSGKLDDKCIVTSML